MPLIPEPSRPFSSHDVDRGCLSGPPTKRTTYTLHLHLLSVCCALFALCMFPKFGVAEPAKTQAAPNASVRATKIEIMKVLRRSRRAVRYCYKQQLLRTPTLEGRVVVRFTIGTNGRVAQQAVASSRWNLTKGGDRVATCLLRRVALMRFVARTKPSIVNYPFVFRSGPMKKRIVRLKEEVIPTAPRDVAKKPEKPTPATSLTPAKAKPKARPTSRPSSRPVSQLAILGGKGLKPRVQGALSVAQIQSTMRSMGWLLQSCYNQGRLTTTKLEGRLVLLFAINEAGAVLSARVTRSQWNTKDAGTKASVEGCLTKGIQAFSFPHAAKPTTVRYPMQFGGAAPSLKPQMAWTRYPRGIDFALPRLSRAIKIGQLYTQMVQEGSSFWLRAEIKKAGWYLFQTTGSSNTFCALYNVKGVRLHDDDNGGQSLNCRVGYRLKPGFYFWRVHVSKVKLSKKIQLSLFRMGAQPLALDTAVQSRFRNRSDLFFYRIDVKKAGVYAFTTSGRSDPICELINSRQRKLKRWVYDDDSGPKYNCALHWYLLPGRYFMIVRPSIFKTASFSLMLRKESPTSPQSSVSVKINHGVRRKFRSVREVQRFAVTLPKAGLFSVSASCQRSEPMLTLLAKDGKTVLGRYGNAMHLRNWVLSRALPKGQYIVEARVSSAERSHYCGFSFLSRPMVSATDLLAANQSKTIKRTSQKFFEQRLFLVRLRKGHHSLISNTFKGNHFCMLESLKGQKVVDGNISYIRSGWRSCQISNTGLDGWFVFRAIFAPKRGISALRKIAAGPRAVSGGVRVARGRPSAAARRRARRRRLRALLRHRSLRGAGGRNTLLGLFGSRRGRSRIGALGRSAGLRMRGIGRAGAGGRYGAKGRTTRSKKVRFFQGIRFWQQKPMVLKAGQEKSFTLTRVGLVPGLFRVMVTSTDLYRFSVSGVATKRCSLHSANANVKVVSYSLSQSQNSCVKAVFLRPGLYSWWVTPKTPGTFKVKWSDSVFRGGFLAAGKTVLAGPVSRRRSFKHSLMVRRSGFFRIEGSLLRGSTVKIRCRLRKGRTTIKTTSTYSIPCRFSGYLHAGFYSLEMPVSRGIGAYTLKVVKFRPKPLRPSRRLSVFLKGGTRQPQYFQINVKSVAHYTIQTSGKLDTLCYILDKSGKRVARDDDGGPGRNCRIRKLLSPGMYLLQLSAFKSSGGTTSLSLRRRAFRVKTLQLGRAGSGYIRSRQHDNRWSFRIQSRGLYIVETQTSSGSRADPKCYVFRGARRVSYNDDGGRGLNCKLRVRLSPGLYTLRVNTISSTRRGAYRVAVRAAGQPFPSSSGAARLAFRRLRRGTASRTRTLVNSVRGLLRPGQQRVVPAHNGQRVDVYRLFVSRSGRFRIETQGTADTKCYLFDGAGGGLHVDDDSGWFANCRIQATLPRGRYILRVRFQSIGQRTGYTLQFRQEAPNPR